MDLELSTVPLTRFQVRNQQAQGGITRAARAGRSRQRRDPLLRRRRRATSTRARSARSSGCSTARTSAARSRGDIGDIVFPPRALEFYTAALEAQRRHRAAAAPGVQGRARLLVRRRVDRDAERARQARRRGARGQPVREHASATATAEDRDAQVERLGDLVRTSGTDLGFVFDPDGETAIVIDDTRPRRSSPSELLLAHRRAGQRGGARRAASRCRSRSASEAERIARARRRGRCAPSSRRRDLMEIAAAPRRRLRGIAGRRLHLARRSCPRTTPRPRWCSCSTCSPRSTGRCRTIVAEVPETHVAHETIVTPWERKGTVMREIVERAKDRADRARRRREDHLPRRVGARAARPRARRSPTCGPRRRATSRPAASPRSTSSASARCSASSAIVKLMTMT